MKFKNDIEAQSNITLDGALTDAGGSPGTVNQLLSSTVTGTAWIDPSTIVAEAATVVVIACKNTSGSTIARGTPVYQTGTVGATATIEIAPADALTSTGDLPAIGLLQTALNNNGFGFVVISGALTNFTTSPIDGVVPVTGDKVFLKSGGGLTLTKPTGSENGIQNLGLIGKVSTGGAGSITVSSIMRTNDVPNLPEGRIWVGDGNTLVSDTVYIDEPNNSLIVNGTTLQTTESLSVIGSGYFSDKISIGTTASTTPANNSYTMNLLDLNSAIAFGDNSVSTQNVIVGEYGSTDTDQLWLHGKNGTIFSHDGDVNEAISIAMVIADDGKIGMGTQTLGTNKLSVVGNTNLSSGLLFTNESLTRVGIGTLFPDELLHVDGPCKIRGLLKLDQNNNSTFAGVNAGNLTNIIGSKNTAFGRDSLSVATSNSNNVAVGFEALKSSNTGNNNVAIGAESMSATTDSNGNNVAIGYQAAKSTNGARNVAIGAAALLANVNGIQNTAIGDNALSSLTSNGNTALGFQAGSNLTNAQNNVIIGYQAQAGAATAQNQIVIGKGAVGDATNNSVVIGNDNILKTILKGNVGINDTVPDTKLVVVDVTKDLTTATAETGQGTVSLVSSDDQAADKGASLLFGGRYVTGNVTNVAFGAITGRKENSITNNSHGYLAFYTAKAGAGSVMHERMRINSDGDVGMNIVDPQSALHVDGGIQLAGDSDTASALKVGTFRYRTSGNNSYVDMCMQTAATTYAWVNIVQNNW